MSIRGKSHLLLYRLWKHTQRPSISILFLCYSRLVSFLSICGCENCEISVERPLEWVNSTNRSTTPANIQCFAFRLGNLHWALCHCHSPHSYFVSHGPSSTISQHRHPRIVACPIICPQYRLPSETINRNESSGNRQFYCKHCLGYLSPINMCATTRKSYVAVIGNWRMWRVHWIQSKISPWLDWLYGRPVQITVIA